MGMILLNYFCFISHVTPTTCFDAVALWLPMLSLLVSLAAIDTAERMIERKRFWETAQNVRVNKYLCTAYGDEDWMWRVRIQY